MTIGKQMIFLGVSLAVAGLALGAAFDDDGAWVPAAGKAQARHLDADGDRHEFVGAFGEGGWLGVTLREAPDGGARIAGVVDDSPAAHAGLERGDVIVGLDGDEIRSPRDLGRGIRDRRPGDQVELEVIRDGSQQTILVDLGESPHSFSFAWSGDDSPFAFEFDGDELKERMQELHERLSEMDLDFDAPNFAFRFDFDDEALEEQMRGLHEHLEGMEFDIGGFALELGGFFGRPRLGVQIVQPTPELREHMGGPRDAGVLVGKVHADSPAEEAGLQVGDLIVSVDGDEVSSAGDISRALRHREGDSISIDVIRDGRSITLDAFIPEPDDEDRDVIVPSRRSRQPMKVAPDSQKA